MDSILIVFYSYTGVSRRLAQLLAAAQGWPVGEVAEVEPRAGGSGTLRCVLDAVLRRRPAVVYSGPNPGDYRTVVLISPVWLYSLSGPMRSFVTNYRQRLPRVAVLSTMGSRGAAHAASEIADILQQTPVLSAAVRAQDVESGACASEVQAFATALQPPAAPPLRPATWSPQAG